MYRRLLVRRTLQLTGDWGNRCPASAYSNMSMRSRGIEEGRLVFMLVVVVRAVLAPKKRRVRRCLVEVGWHELGA